MLINYFIENDIVLNIYECNGDEANNYYSRNDKKASYPLLKAISNKKMISLDS